MALSNKKRHVAVFFNSDGEEVGKKSFDARKKHFNYNHGKYLIYPKECSRFKVDGFWKDTYYYHYPLGVPHPFKFYVNSEKDNIPKLYVSSQDLRTIIESEKMKEVNDFDKNNPLENLSTKQIVIGVLVIIGLGYTFMNGGI